MIKIQRVSYILQIVFKITFIALPLLSVFFWFYLPIPCPAHSAICTNILPADLNITDVLGTTSSLTLVTRFLGWLVTLIPTAIQMFAVYCLIKLFRLYELGRFFTLENVRYIRYIGITLIINELINPFIQALLSLVLTFHNGPEHRAVALSFSNHDLTSILIGVIVLLISWVMAEACKLHEEQTYTV